MYLLRSGWNTADKRRHSSRQSRNFKGLSTDYLIKMKKIFKSKLKLRGEKEKGGRTMISKLYPTYIRILL